MTQIELVERHLKDYGSITSWEAIEDYGITRLSSVIFTLRKNGMNIESQDVTKKNRYGQKTTFARYIYKPEPEQTSMF